VKTNVEGMPYGSIFLGYEIGVFEEYKNSFLE
jgi:hypothetical protein